MTDFVCIVGLPGSGKTFLANTMGEEGCVIIDDIVSLDQLPCDGDAKTVIITDPRFCITEIRMKADRFLKGCYTGSSRWIFFSNNPKACLQNVIRRDDGRAVNEFILALAKNYDIPEGAEIVEVFQSSHPNL